MASMFERPKGSGAWVIQFPTPAGKVKTISIGKCSRRNCETVLRHVRALIESRKLGTPHPTGTAEWLTQAPEEVKEKLAAVGLLDWSPPNPLAMLGPFLAEYIRIRRKTLKIASIIALEQCVRCLVKHFGADRPLTSIDHVAAEGFHEYLLTLSLSPVTVQKRISQARTFLTYARRCKLVTENAFEFIRAAGGDMTAKQEYVPEGVILQIIEAAPSAHWRLLIALGRSAGLRMVSEPFSMKWGDIDWAKGRITVTAPKTEGRAGKAYRVIPLFPSIRPYLEECWDLAEEGDEYVFPASWRKRAQGKGGWANANFRTQFMRIAKRAGIQPWPKLFNNCVRRVRQTSWRGSGLTSSRLGLVTTKRQPSGIISWLRTATLRRH